MPEGTEEGGKVARLQLGFLFYFCLLVCLLLNDTSIEESEGAGRAEACEGSREVLTVYDAMQLVLMVVCLCM